MRSIIAITLASAGLAFSATAAAGPGEDLIAKEKCSKCHTATTTKKAPSFASLAEKAKGDAKAAARMLNTLKTGANDHDKVAASDDALKAAIAVVLATK